MSVLYDSDEDYLPSNTKQNQEIAVRPHGTYSITKLCKLTRRQQSVKIKVKDLQSILSRDIWEDDRGDPIAPILILDNGKMASDHYERIKTANLAYPILIHKTIVSKRGRVQIDVLDGVHRLAKAYVDNYKYIDAKEVTDDQLRRAKIKT